MIREYLGGNVMNEQYEITEAELEIMQVLRKNKRGNLTTIMEELSKKSKNEERKKRNRAGG